MDVVDKIASAETDDKDKPKTDIKIEKIEILKTTISRNNEKRTKRFSFSIKCKFFLETFLR